MAQTSAKKKTTAAKAAKKPAANPKNKKAVPATPDDIMKFLEADDKKIDAIAGAQVKTITLLKDLIERVVTNLLNMDKSMVVIKDELKDDLKAHGEHIDERFDTLEEKVDKIQEDKCGPVLTGKLLLLAGFVTVLVIAIVAVLATKFTSYNAFETGMISFFSGIVIGGIILVAGIFRGTSS